MTTLANNTFQLRELKDEVLQDYKKISMLISTIRCDFKCCRDLKTNFCQNSDLMKQPIYILTYNQLYERYRKNELTKAIIFGGLEPFLQFDELVGFIRYMRIEMSCDDDIVIYTGYNENEIQEQIDILRQYENIIVKFGRFVPDDTPRYDDVLGIKLASSNQYAVHLK